MSCAVILAALRAERPGGPAELHEALALVSREAEGKGVGLTALGARAAFWRSRAFRMRRRFNQLMELLLSGMNELPARWGPMIHGVKDSVDAMSWTPEPVCAECGHKAAYYLHQPNKCRDFETRGHRFEPLIERG